MLDVNVVVRVYCLKGNLKLVSFYLFFLNFGLCFVIYIINKVVAFIEISREMCGDKVRELVGKRKDSMCV